MKLTISASAFILEPTLILHPLILHLCLVSSVRQHRFDSLLVGFRHQRVNVEQTLSLVLFLGQNMARMRMAALDLSGGGQTKTLGRTLVCF
jgi:hypothetical protein